MTPKEKAKELIDKYYYLLPFIGTYNDVIKLSKQCALIAVDEILEAIDWHDFETPNKQLEYWQEVKQEIEKL